MPMESLTGKSTFILRNQPLPLVCLHFLALPAIENAGLTSVSSSRQWRNDRRRQRKVALHAANLHLIRTPSLRLSLQSVTAQAHAPSTCHTAQLRVFVFRSIDPFAIFSLSSHTHRFFFLFFPLLVWLVFAFAALLSLSPRMRFSPLSACACLHFKASHRALTPNQKQLSPPTISLGHDIPHVACRTPSSVVSRRTSDRLRPSDERTTAVSLV